MKLMVLNKCISLGEELNIYDLIQSYASMIASVGDSSQKPIMAIENDSCHNCGEIGHHSRNCTKPKRKGKGRGKGGKTRDE